MATVQVRIEGNALTTPPSYSVRFVPKDTLGYDELAAEVVQMHPNYAQEDAKTIIMAAMERIGANLINGNQTVLPDAFTFGLSFSARLESPDDPLPPVEDMLNVRVHASKACTETVQRAVQIERLPMTEKAPLITAAEDTVLGLKDILHSGGALQLTGSNLLFDPKKPDEACVIEGTRSGRTVQTRFVGIANTEVTLLPDIPAQNDPWNNEYTLSIATHYTANGTLRTGIYRRKLRTPLTLTNFGHPNPPDVGILTDKAASPYVTVTGGSLSADETVRIQAILDLHTGSLSLNLLDMTEGGRAGAAVQVLANGAYVLPGFSGSALSSLNITVNNFADLVKMIRSGYSSRLVEVLVLKMN
ncbi:MAG: hypothetical protein CDV28_1103 [Candidatus Electronema aureum]|uniref:DUF4469 domain-containing protein n=1 Tax=Candidatus Electronema aureum TaxID=2005002 RepID=A0A521G292_9BACT|nr:MAG: hypothetical protein CDV28_1103 [Candidatus Electronema aureum]